MDRAYRPTIWWMRTLAQRLDSSHMKRIDVGGYYKLGANLQSLLSIRGPIDADTAIVELAEIYGWLSEFAASDPAGLETCRLELPKITAEIDKIFNSSKKEGEQWTDYKFVDLREVVKRFQTLLFSETEKSPVFSVTPKGIYDTLSLVDHAERELEESVSDDAKKDFAQAGRCLAFELFTATGFHAMRALEGVARRYHKVVTRAPTLSTKPLGPLINDLREQLSVENPHDDEQASTSPLGLIIAFLARITKIYRNPIMHPEMIVDEQSAKRVFKLASNVIADMEEDIAVRTNSGQ
jgi:hypothetical protein